MSTTHGAVLVSLSEEVVSRLLELRRSPNERLVDVVERLTGSGVLIPAPPERAMAEPCCASGRYIIRILGEVIMVDTLAEALSRALNVLADLDSGFLSQLELTGGRTRRNVARRRDSIHPGRSDLNESYTRELRPGWYIGTNYAYRDVCRILGDACRIAGLHWGSDMELVDNQAHWPSSSRA